MFGITRPLFIFVFCLIMVPSALFAARYRGSMPLVDAPGTSGYCQEKRIMNLRTAGLKIFYKINRQDFAGDLQPDGSFRIAGIRAVAGPSGQVWTFEVKGKISNAWAKGSYTTGPGRGKCIYSFDVPLVEKK